MTRTALETVQLWHQALNAGDINRLLALSTADIEVGGPRGSGHGSDLLREWLGRAGISMEPVRFFTQGQTVVVEQEARWHAPGTSEPGDPQRVASVFTVQDGRVVSVIRYPSLGDALGASGLTEQDQ